MWWEWTKAIFSVIDALLTVFAIIYGVVSAVGAATHDRWDEAIFWIAFLILVKLHKDNEK